VGANAGRIFFDALTAFVLCPHMRLLEIDHSVWKQSYNACPAVLYSIDIGSVSVFTVQIDDTSDETEVSTTTSVRLILCASLVCMLFSSKSVIVVVSLKEVCEFTITYSLGVAAFFKSGGHGRIGPLKQKVRGPGPRTPGSYAYAGSAL